MNDLSILDCTFRDGGYHTNWHFEVEHIAHYIDHVNTLPIDLVDRLSFF